MLFPKKKSAGLKRGVFHECLNDSRPGQKKESGAVRCLAPEFLVRKIEFDTKKACVGQSLMVDGHKGVMHVITGPMGQDHGITLTLGVVFRYGPNGADREIRAYRNGDK